MIIFFLPVPVWIFKLIAHHPLMTDHLCQRAIKYLLALIPIIYVVNRILAINRYHTNQEIMTLGELVWQKLSVLI